jgi:hypothetical protein
MIHFLLQFTKFVIYYLFFLTGVHEVVPIKNLVLIYCFK